MNITLELALGKYSTLSLRCKTMEEEFSDDLTEGILYCNCVEPEKFLLCAKNPQLIMPNGNKTPIKMVTCVKSGEQTIIKYKHINQELINEKSSNQQTHNFRYNSSRKEGVSS